MQRTGRVSTTMNVREFLSRLIDAFVEAIGPVVGRFVSSDRIVAVEEDDDLAFFHVSRGRAAALGSLGTLSAPERRRLGRARSGAVELRLRPDRVITRTLRLPAAGRDYLEPIIEHRLERLTPWRPEKVLYGFAAEGEADAEGQIAVEFAATSQDIADAGIARLASLGLAPTAIGPAGEAVERPLALDLYRGQRDVGRRLLRRAAVLALAVLLPATLSACLASFWFAYAAEKRLATIETRFAAVRRAIAEAAGQGDARNRDLALIDSKRPENSIVVLIDKLAGLVPSDTFLREMEIAPDRVRLVGLSANAPALIGVLEAGGVLSDVRFAAPVTRDGENRDSFDIVAARAGAAPAEARP